MTSALRQLYYSSFGRGVAVIASGTAIAQAIPIALTPILTRLYTPDDLGKLGLYTAFISFLANVLSLGYSSAIVTGRSDYEGLTLTVLSCLIVLPASIIGGILLLVLSVQGWLGFGELPLWTSAAMAISLVLTGVFFALRSWLVRVGSYRVISSATVSQSIGRMGTQIVGGLFGLHWIGLIFGEIVGRGAGFGTIWKAVRPEMSEQLHHLKQVQLRAAASRYKKFPLYTAPSALLNNLALVLPVPLITMYFGIQSAGQYSIASRVMVLPLALIGASVGDVFHSRIAILSRHAPDRAQRLFFSVVGTLFLLGLLPAVVVGLWGSDLFPLILGSSWEESGTLAAAIVPWVLVQFAVSPVSRLVQVYQGQELKLVYDVMALISVLGVLSFGAYEGWSLESTCRLLGWSQATVYGLYLILLLLILKKYKMINASGDEAYAGQ